MEEFYKILDKLDRDLKFAYSDELGYVTARPYDLGFTRIEVKVELKDLKKMEQPLKDHIEGHYLTRENPNKRLTIDGDLEGCHGTYIQHEKDEINEKLVWDSEDGTKIAYHYAPYYRW